MDTMTTMNHLGAQAWEHWKQYRAAELATIEDPQRYFTQLGNELEQEIDRQTTHRQYKEKAGEIPDDLARMGRLSAIHRETTEAVMQERVFGIEDPS